MAPRTDTVHPSLASTSVETLAIHADDHLSSHSAVAPPIHLSTTFSYDADPSKLIALRDRTERPDEYIYSREATPNSTRLEAVLTALLKAPAITYSSGLSALFAIYTLLNPKKVAITGGYHGAHGVLEIHTRLSGLKVLPLDCDAENLGPGDVIHVETPVNPTGEARNLTHFADKARSRGAYLVVDATFGPPGLQDPFNFGADIVMHSGTKYIGGHSDMLCGVVATRNTEWYAQLRADRLHLGSVMGSLEGWLGIRSVRTLELRVATQSANAEKLVLWLHGSINRAEQYACVKEMGQDVRRVVKSVTHASVQSEQDLEWIRKQMPGGFGPVFALEMHTEDQAKALPSKLNLFHHATSLGGIESLVEWRAMSDPSVQKTILRFSIGIERWEDLREDLWHAFKSLAS